MERLEAEVAAKRGHLTEGTQAKLESRRSEFEAISTEAALTIHDPTREGCYYDWVDEWSNEGADGSRGDSASRYGGLHHPQPACETRSR